MNDYGNPVAFLTARLIEDERAARGMPLAARALRQVEADRALLLAYRDARAALDDAEDDHCWDARQGDVIALFKWHETTQAADWNGGAVSALQAMIAIRAGIYSDHPDYRQKWHW
jgi:hypothetical protein